MARPPTISREEPEDEAPPSGNLVDVVDVGPTATRAVVTLRRELARLSQQAALVERSLEDQGRDRKETNQRLDLATQRVLVLEHRLLRAEAETESMKRLHETALEDLGKIRDERDGLALVIQTARAATEEVSRMRVEAERLRAAHETANEKAAALEVELTDIRRRQFQDALKATDADAEVGKLREHIERAEAATVQARATAASLTEEAAKAKQEAAEARGAVAKLRDEHLAAAEHASKERAEAQTRIDRLTRELEDASSAKAAELDASRKAVEDARELEAAAKSALVQTKAELEATRADRDAAHERADRHVDELTSSRQVETTLRAELEAALATSTRLAGRAETVEKTHASLLHAMKLLYEEIAAGFARSGVASPTPSGMRAAVTGKSGAPAATNAADGPEVVRAQTAPDEAAPDERPPL